MLLGVILPFVLAASTVPSIVPAPASIQVQAGSYAVPDAFEMQVPKGFEREGKVVAEMLAKVTGRSARVKTASKGAQIRFVLSGVASEGEAYKLKVDASGIEVQASTPTGLFRGAMTAVQIVPSRDQSTAVPYLMIEDAPKFRWRGLHLDVGRHFMPKEFVLKYIDLLALHRFSTFHWHLTEDQGWRIEIKKYPNLTKVGAWRKDTMLTTSPETYSGEPHGGFYTQKEIREVVQYAADRHITIVPEIEMPGHSLAAIASYPELGNHPEKKLDVGTRWGVYDSVFNPSDSTILFLKDVLTEVMDLFPGEFIHIGGDECPKTEWKASELAQSRIKEFGLANEHELQSWFIRQIDSFLTSHGRRLVGWDEILEGGLAPGATVMSWRGMQGGIAAAQAGHDVVMTPGGYTYFDHYQSIWTEDEPKAIGGFTDLRRVYSFNPVPPELNEQQAVHVLGAQGQLWSEYLRTPKHVEYMAYPRACALAEVLWTGPSACGDTHYDDFFRRLNDHTKRLDAFQLNYRPLEPRTETLELWKWTPEISSTEWREAAIDVSNLIQSPGTYRFRFVYSKGAHAAEFESAVLEENGHIIAQDLHPGKAGNETSRNEYRMVISQVQPGAKKVLKVRYRTDGGTDSFGTMFASKVVGKPSWAPHP